MPPLPWYRRPGLVPAVVGAAVGVTLLAAVAWHLGRAPRAATASRSDGGNGGPLGARRSIAAALQGGDTGGFARALAPRPFRFPADLGAHPDFRTEWWYFTGNLAADDGRRFGFQLTFFRVALAPPGGAARSSAWATRQIYFAHFALTDVAGRRFYAREQWQRGAAGLAGAQASPLRVWVGSWSATGAPPGPAVPAATAGPALPTEPAAFAAPAGPAAPTAPTRSGAPTALAAPAAAVGPIRLFADAARQADAAGDQAPGGSTDRGYALDLSLAGNLPPVAQGDRGLSMKSGRPGNASYYYSLPRLAARGELRVGGERFTVSGLAWMDHEWSTSALDAGEVGWDWFGLQLDDGWELMLYRLRRSSSQAGPAGLPAPGAAAASATDPAHPAAGLADPASRATLIAPDGTTRVMPLSAWQFVETATWTSPATGIRYPSAWRLRYPAAGAAGPARSAGPAGSAGPPGPAAPADIELTVRPLLADQELPLSLRYWEGAAAAAGTHDGRPVSARGYVELTGYGDAIAAATTTPAHAPATMPAAAAPAALVAPATPAAASGRRSPGVPANTTH
jgi:predicted secreted hydrolase